MLYTLRSIVLAQPTGLQYVECSRSHGEVAVFLSWIQCWTILKPQYHFVISAQGIGRFEAICEGCIVPCQDCIVEDNTSVPICTATFAHANSGGGATVIEEVVVDTGYWRASNKSSTVLSCYNTDACLGGVTGDPDYCLEGYEGPCKRPTTMCY